MNDVTWHSAVVVVYGLATRKWLPRCKTEVSMMGECEYENFYNSFSTIPQNIAI
jgi:hypothetical protein